MQGTSGRYTLPLLGDGDSLRVAVVDAMTGKAMAEYSVRELGFRKAHKAAEREVQTLEFLSIVGYVTGGV